MVLGHCHSCKFTSISSGQTGKASIPARFNHGTPREPHNATFPPKKLPALLRAYEAHHRPSKNPLLMPFSGVGGIGGRTLRFLWFKVTSLNFLFCLSCMKLRTYMEASKNSAVPAPRPPKLRIGFAAFLFKKNMYMLGVTPLPGTAKNEDNEVCRDPLTKRCNKSGGFLDILGRGPHPMYMAIPNHGLTSDDDAVIEFINEPSTFVDHTQLYIFWIKIR